MIGRLVHFVLDHGVRPREPHSIDARVGAQTEHQRNALVGGLFVARAGFHLDLGFERDLGVLDAFQRHFDPVAVGRRHVAVQVERTVFGDPGPRQSPVAIEIRVDIGATCERPRRGRRLPFSRPVEQLQTSSRQVGAAVVIYIGGRERAGAGRQGVQRNRLISSAKLVAVEHACAVLVGYRQVEAGRVWLQVERHGVQRASSHEGKTLGFVAETGVAVVAQQTAIVADQKKVLVVIVVEIQPNGLPERAAGQVGLLLEAPLHVAVERRALLGDDAQIGQAVVIKIAGRYEDHVAQPFEARIRGRRPAIAEKRHPARRPRNQAGAGAIQVQNGEAGGSLVESAGDLLRAVDRWRKRRGRRLVDGIVDFRVDAPLQVFRNGRAFLFLLYVLKNGQLRGALRAIGLAVETVKLEVRARQTRIEVARLFKLPNGGIHLLLGFVQRAELIVRCRLVRRQAQHLLKLRLRLVEIPHPLVSDAQVEPGVRQLGVLLLHLLQLRHAILHVAGAQQRQTVVQTLASRIRRQGQRLPELFHGLLRHGGVLIEGLSQIAVLPQQRLVGRADLGVRQPPAAERRRQRRRGEAREAAQIPALIDGFVITIGKMGPLPEGATPAGAVKQVGEGLAREIRILLRMRVRQ